MFAHRFRALAAIDPSGWSLAKGVRAGLGCSVPLLLAEWLDQPALSWAAFIGFWVALVDPGWPRRTRLLAISFFIAGTSVGCFLAVLVRPYLLASTVFALIWCFAATLMRVWGDAAGSAGNLLALAVLIVLGLGQSSSMQAATDIAALTVGGGLWGMALAFGIGWQRPDAPARAALASVFRAQAAFVRDMISAEPEPVGKPPSHPRRGAVREAIETTRAILMTPRGGRLALMDGQRFIPLLGDAERALRPLLALRELLADLPPEQVPRTTLATVANRLDEIAAALQENAQTCAVTLRPIQLPAADIAVGDAADALRSAVTWMDAAAERLSSRAAQPGPASSLESDHPTGYLKILRNNLTFESLSFRHAARFAVTGACLTLITNGLHLDRGYWITLTAVIILQAYPSATWQRTIQRVAGSILGGLIATCAAFFLRGPAEATLVIVPLSFLAMAFRAVSYAIYILCITPLFILISELFDQGGVLAPTIGGLRILDNLAGASAGLLATFVLWPSWESRYLRQRLATDIRCNGAFLLAALDAPMGKFDEQQVEAARRRAGLAGNNVEASLRRALDEPRRRSAAEIEAAMTITAAARRLAGIASVIMQIAPDAPVLAEPRESLRWRLDEVASAIEHAREPASMPALAADPSERSPLGEQLHRAWQQLLIVHEAAGTLAAKSSATALTG